ncbi:RrF2 family transcriptional regulator [Sphingomonas quercus]|uniref:Rrf2 family transcriptional regulator n=1 Tax=Sphingomonas quercus TaxID=2842451 RepID=A0ABS6BIH6_9SPHN|nr:Rrf2 family transcriptional regulator [Sphingomonas quercus]MBU3078104.1 Rrf2 family transcriptional regulator [Sphingomonas quercus]
MERSEPPVEPRPTVSLYGASVEYALHCMMWLIRPREKPVSARDLAAMQGVSPSLLAKIMPRLEKAGLVESTGGIGGGYRLASPADDITVLDVVDAVEGGRRLFECREVRRNCTLFDGEPPAWSSCGTCGIHAVMLRAERAMRAEMERTSLLSLARSVRYPPEFQAQVSEWFDERAAAREDARVTAIRAGAGRRRGPSAP